MRCVFFEICSFFLRLCFDVFSVFVLVLNKVGLSIILLLMIFILFFWKIFEGMEWSIYFCFLNLSVWLVFGLFWKCVIILYFGVKMLIIFFLFLLFYCNFNRIFIFIFFFYCCYLFFFFYLFCCIYYIYYIYIRSNVKVGIYLIWCF